MKLVALALFAMACRREAAVEQQRAQPLEPSGQPVAQAPAPASDERDDRTATGDDRADDDRDLPPIRDVPLDRGDTRDTPPRDVPSVDDELPPSLFEANRGPKDKAKPDKPKDEKPARDERPASKHSIAPVKAALCVTTGAAKLGGKIDKPAMRAVAKGTDGEAASITFTFDGETATTKKLASGDVRKQIGLKLRAENGCNLIYVMWRLDPKPMILAQVKRNPGAKDHKACGADNYKWVKAQVQNPPPALVAGDKHTMRAEIENQELSVFVDDTLYWRGKLPSSVHDLRGPAGIRSDNLAFDLVSFDAATTNVDVGNAKCVEDDKD